MIIDYLSFTMKISDAFELYASGQYCGYSLGGQWRHQLDLDSDMFTLATVNALLACANRSGQDADLQTKIRDKGMFGYQRSIVIMNKDSQQVGLAAYGGNGGTLLISMTGQGCRLLDMEAVASLLGQVQAKITRVDIAHDDFEGQYPVQFAVDAYYADRFTLRSRPKARLIDDCGNSTGKTFYVGNAKNGKMVRIYEKGKQLGQEDSPWVRWELQLNSVDRVLPHDILKHPMLYFLDGYPVLRDLGLCLKAYENVAFHQVVVTKETRAIAYDRLVKYCRLSYGKLFTFMADEMALSPTAIFSDLFRGGVPARLLTDLSHYRSVVLDKDLNYVIN